MAKLSKKAKLVAGKFDAERLYGVNEAFTALRDVASKKFDETVEIALNLGVDPRHADQMVRGMVSLPSGTGKEMKVAVFAKGDKAAEAEKAGAGMVALIDADPQGSLADWWNEREAPTPVFVHTSQQRLEQDVESVRELGVDLLIIDTPPAITATISDVIRVSDVVLIPTRPSPHDLRSVGRTVELVEALSKPLIFVVNGATPRARITSQAAIALSQHGTLAPSIIHQRVDFAASMIDGRTVMELDPRSRSAKEIAKLWDYLKNRMERNMRPTTIGAGGNPMSAAGPTDMDRVHRQDTN